jgi:transposase, IS5 family
MAGRRNLTPQLSKLLKRRSAIEPVIGHTKHDHRMNRNYLLGKIGDRINALLSGSAWNLKKF